MIEQKKRILIITDTFRAMAGSERNITYFLNNGDQNISEFFVACFTSGKLASDMREKGFSVSDLHEAGIYTFNGIRNLILLRRLIYENRISLIVTFHESSDVYGFVLSVLCNVPIISSRRDMGFKTKFHYKMMYKLLGRFFDAVVAVSDTVRMEVINQRWFPSEKITTVYNGVNFTEYNRKDIKKIKENLGIKAGHQIVGLIANLRKIKGIHHFIEAASIICRQRDNLDFFIVGGDTDERGYTKADLEKLAKSLGILQKIHFLGKRTDIPELIALFDVAVNSSLSEGLSNTVLEYMASSKPVVATNVGGNSEVVIDGETGFIVPPKDSNALANAILSILKDKEMGIRFGIAGRKRIEESFSIEKMITNFQNLFEKVISGYKNNRINAESEKAQKAKAHGRN